MLVHIYIAMAHFDLNIDNYTLDDLKEIFSLSNTYQDNELEENAKKLTENIQTNANLDDETKTSTKLFIEKGKNILHNHATPNISTMTIKSQPQNVATKLYNPVHPSEYFPPLINPVQKEDRSIVLNIDSRFRENYYVSRSSDFHITLPMKIQSVVSMELAAIEFPPTAFFSVSKVLSNNYFYISAGSSTSGDLETIKIVLPDGNFTPAEGTLSILDILTAQTTSTYLQYITFFVAETSTKSGGSGQIIAGVSENYPFSAPFTFTLDFQAGEDGSDDPSTPLPLKLGWKLGYRNGKYTGNSCYVSEGVASLSGASYLYLAVDDYNNYSNTFFSAFNASVLNKDILARIAVQSSRSTSIVYSNIGRVTTPRQYYGPVDIEKMHVRMLDEYGRILNLNNMDFSFAIQFKTGKQVASWSENTSDVST